MNVVDRLLSSALCWVIFGLLLLALLVPPDRGSRGQGKYLR